MAVTTDQSRQPGTLEPASAAGTPWRWYAPLTLVVLAALTVLFSDTVTAMAVTWWRSETFAHGMLVVPISAYLIWRRRRAIAAIPPAPDAWALPVLLVLGFGWLAAALADVLVVKQLAYMGMVVGTVWLLCGWRATRAMAFPLVFLFLAVPMGEGLMRPLMDFTANFTVGALQLTGIPVYKEGTFFEIPSGRWSVVEGCSGLRYLIASVTLGILYAYLSYRSFWRRAAFVLLSVVFPIIANGLRAYMIVMIAHLSDMKLALGVDHLIYGWVFFGLVMLLMFWIGSFWWEKGGAPSLGGEPEQMPDGNANPAPRTSPPRALATAVVALAVVAIWPLWAGYVEAGDGGHTPVRFELPSPAGEWTPVSQTADWEPHYVKPSALIERSFGNGSHTVGAYVAYYQGQHQGSELVNSRNVMVVQKHPVWRNVGQREIEKSVADQRLAVVETRLESDRQELLVWHWYWIGGQHTTNDYMAKLYEVIHQLLGEGRHGAGVVVYTPIDAGRIDDARDILGQFTDGWLPALERRLDRVSQSAQ